MSVLKRIRRAMTGVLGRRILWLWFKTSRIEVQGGEEYARLRDDGRPVILIIWHSRIFIAPYFFRKRGIMPLISPSEDGEIVARIVSGWGYKNLRGSSSHSIIGAWREMKRELGKGGELIIVPDGPRGPAGKLKPGCVKLSQESGACIVPFSYSASRVKRFRSWDRFLLPHPFSKILVVFGRPILVDPGLRGGAFEEERTRIEQVLTALDEAADGRFGPVTGRPETRA